MIECNIDITVFKFESSKYRNATDIKVKLELQKDEGSQPMIDSVTEIFNTLLNNKVFEVKFLRNVNENEFNKLKQTKLWYENLVIR